VEVRFAEPVEPGALVGLAGVRDVEATDGLLRLHVQGPMDALVKELARHRVVSLTSEEPELDEIFLSFYGRGHEG
jgi:ABC-2 type transport system ATP-binding protein